MPVRRSPKQQALARKIYAQVCTPKTSKTLERKIYGMVTWSTQYLRNTSQSSKVPREQRMAAEALLALRMPNMRKSKQMTFGIDGWTKQMYNARYDTAYSLSNPNSYLPLLSRLKGSARTKRIYDSKLSIRSLNSIPVDQRKSNHKAVINRLRKTIMELEDQDAQYDKEYMK